MKFNIDDIINDMLGGAKDVIKSDWKNIKQTAELFFEQKKKRIGMIANFRLQNEIDDKELVSFLNDEKLLLASEIAALKIITKAMAQKAANAALDILYAAINKALSFSGKPK